MDAIGQFNLPRLGGARRAVVLVAAATVALAGIGGPTVAQSLDPWTAGVDSGKPAPSPPATDNTTVIQRADGEAKAAPGVKLVALLTADGQQIDQGMVWRIFQPGAAGAKSVLVSELRQAAPSVKLEPGEYIVNAAFGRANLTKKILVTADQPQTAQFVLNAGGLRVNAVVGGKSAPAGAVTYAIYSDDRDQFDNRTALMTGAKPNLIIRLNAGIYRLVSTYGDANARVETDVTVEAGKLTEATLTHAAGRAMFKLVTRAGGEAIPDTAWTVQTAAGEIVKESIGALPAHYFAPGAYVVAARSGGLAYTAKFEVKEGETTVVEVLQNGGAAATATAPSPAPTTSPTTTDAPSAFPPGFDIQPSFDVRNP